MKRFHAPLLTHLLFIGNAAAQCIVGNTNAPGTDPTNVEIGQSFTSTCDGTVEYVEIYCTGGGTNVAGQLKICSGSTVTSTPIHTQAQPATAVGAGEYLRIYLTAPVSIIGFDQLTFELPMSLEIPYSGGNPYPSGRMFYNGTNASLYANSDIRFNVSIISDCVPSASSISASACQSFLSPSGQQWTVSGVYSDTIPNVQGCDSVITVDLEVIDLDTTVTLDGMDLTANGVADGYQWIDCITNEAIIDATSASFTATTAGSYAVQLTTGGCTEQSACVFASSTHVAAHSAPTLIAYPGPMHGSIVVPGLPAQAAVQLMDVQGRTVPTTRQQDLIQASAACAGIHLLRITWPGRDAFVQRVMLQ